MGTCAGERQLIMMSMIAVDMIQLAPADALCRVTS